MARSGISVFYPEIKKTNAITKKKEREKVK
jgi:hypothetical protein